MGATPASSPSQAAEPSQAAAPAVAPAVAPAPDRPTTCGGKTCGEGERCFLIRVGRGTPMAAPGKTSSFECRRQPPSRNSGYMCSPTTHGYTLCDYLAPVERPRVQSAPSPYLL